MERRLADQPTPASSRPHERGDNVNHDFMTAVRFHGEGDVRVDAMAVPEIGPRDALLRMRAVGICTTDQKIAKHGHFKLPAEVGPRVLGHEVVGEIAEVGKDVRHLQPGTRVVVAPVFGCGHCVDCVRGDAQLCSQYEAFGITVDGGMSEFMVLPERAIERGNAMPLPAAISDEDAVLLEPLACCYNSLQACEMRPGKNLFVVGAGPMGLMHIALARAFGAAKVIVSDSNAHRLRVARTMGADVTIDVIADDVTAAIRDATDGRGADVVVVTAGSAEAQSAAVEWTARYGYVHLFASLPYGTDELRISSNRVHYQQIRITGTSGASLTHFRIVASLVSTKRIQAQGLVTGVFPLQDAELAFQEGRRAEHLRVVLVPDADRVADLAVRAVASD